MPIDDSLYTQLTLPSLFVQPPVPSNDTADPIDTIVTKIRNLDKSRPYTDMISITHLTRQAILSTAPTETTIPVLYALWELHLSALIFAHELTLAQQEAKRLSMALDSIVKTKQPKSQKASPISGFPPTTPMSLKLLLIRLRSNGPTVQALSESYAILWDQRQTFTKETDKNSRQIRQTTLTILSYGVGATLVAKREYGTLLTLADSVENKRMKFLAVLVSLMKGDWELASSYLDGLSSTDEFADSLKTVLKNTNPVLDPNKEDMGVNIDVHVENLDDIFALTKSQAITGRIVCALFAVFELQLRDPGATGEDILRGRLDGAISEAMSGMFRFWMERASKLYAFE